MTEFEMIAKTFLGLEEVLAKELIELGANDIQIGNRMVSFTGDKALLYKANFHLRTAIRILKPFLHFKADSADEVYEICKKRVEWDQFMGIGNSFAVDAVVNSEDFKHSKFVAYRVKDAIADYFREKTGKRPNVSVANPDITFHIHISHDDCSLSLDSSGESLHRRGYRQDTMEAPLNEVLAAGMLLLAGWDGQTDFVDPMCGSGTLPIEAALIARNMAPGLFRTKYAFEKWNDFDKDLFESIYNDDSEEREFTHKIYGFDKDPKAVAVAKRNAKAASLADTISFETQDFKDFKPVTEKTLMVTNPPYGERLNPDDLMETYQMIGERLKNAMKGSEAWIISYKYECFDKIGLKPSAKIPLFNGALPCELRKYEIFEGKYKNFREEGQELKKDDAGSRRGTTLRQQARRAEKLAAREAELDASNTEAADSLPQRRSFSRDHGRSFDKSARTNSGTRSGARGGSRTGGAPSYRKNFSDGAEHSFHRDTERRPERNFGEKPERKSFAEKKSFGSSSREAGKSFGGGERKSFRDGGKSFGGGGKSFGNSERKSFGSGERKSFGGAKRGFSGRKRD